MLSELAASRGMLTFDYGMSVTAAEYMVDMVSYIRAQTRPMSMAAHMIGQFFSSKKRGGRRSPLGRGGSQTFDAMKDQSTLKSVFAQVNKMSGGKGSGRTRSQAKTNPVSAPEFVRSVSRSRVGR